MNDAEELTRLRARVAELEAAQGAASAPAHHTGRSTTRGFTSAVLVVLACVLAPVAVLSVWASTVVSDTDRYVETVAPVAEDPGVQSAIADEVTTAIMDNLDVAGLTSEALDALAAQDDLPPRVADTLPALATPLTQGIESFTRTQAARLLASDEFEAVWAEVNRIAHTQVVALLEGDQGGVLTAEDNQITLNLAPVIEEVKTRLVDQGFELAARIPTIDKMFTLVESDGITQAQRAYSLLDALGVWLPFVALGILAVGVLLARDRRRALLRGSLGVAAAMVLLGVSLTLLRVTYVETTPAEILSATSAGHVFDTLVRFLRTALRATAVLALLVALAAFLTGPSAAAARVRHVYDRGVGSARGGADAAGWHLDPAGRWVRQHRAGLRLTVFVGAGLALVVWPQPTVGVVLVVALLVIVALTVVAFLGSSPGPAPAVVASDHGSTGPNLRDTSTDRSEDSDRDHAYEQDRHHDRSDGRDASRLPPS